MNGEFGIIKKVYSETEIIPIKLRKKTGEIEIMVVMVAFEAYFEAFPQLLLQTYTIINGYPVTKIQLLAMSASFILLAKISIQFDMMEYKKGFIQDLCYILKVIPLYCTSIIYRCMSLALILSYFKYWAAIPVVLYVCKMIILAKNIVDSKFKTMFGLSLPNMGIINGGTAVFGDVDRDQLKRFLLISTITTFFYYAIWLSIIIVLVRINPNTMEHWADIVIHSTYPKSPEAFNFLSSLYVPTNLEFIIIIVIGVGVVNVLLSYFGIKFLKVGDK